MSRYRMNVSARETLQPHVDVLARRFLAIINDYCTANDVKLPNGMSAQAALITSVSSQMFALSIEDSAETLRDRGSKPMLNDAELEQTIKSMFHLYVEEHFAQRKLVRFPGERRINPTTH